MVTKVSLNTSQPVSNYDLLQFYRGMAFAFLIRAGGSASFSQAEWPLEGREYSTETTFDENDNMVVTLLVSDSTKPPVKGIDNGISE